MEGILFLKYPDWPKKAPCALVHGKVVRRSTLNTRLKKTTSPMACPASPFGDLWIYVSRRSYQKGKQFNKIMKLFGYANLPDAGPLPADRDNPGETLIINVPFPEVFYYKT